MNRSRWFEDVTDIETLRKQYRELLKKFHPDNEGGSVEITQEINAEYDRLFVILGKESKADGHSYTQEENEEFKAILNAISGFNMTVEIIGQWIWAFDSYAYKDRLKELGFKYAPKKRAWTWHSGEYRRHHKKEVPLSHIRAKYVCQTVRSQSRQYALD